MKLLALAWVLPVVLVRVVTAVTSVCNVTPAGPGKDDTDQVEAAIAHCGYGGSVILNEGVYNITRKMTWNLTSSRVDLHGYLTFKPDPEYWLDANNTYRVVFIQDQASWFVVTGKDFTIDAHNIGGIDGNGQTWWSFYGNRSRSDGDGRPIAFTLSNVTRGTVRDFRIEAQPFWCNTVADSRDVVYDGMYCNATNTDPVYAGQNVVPNTDGGFRINTYRSDNVQLLNWDITCGDDCLAIKGNSTNIEARNVTCHGGNGIAVGSLGQYVNLPDIVDNVTFEDVKLLRLNPQVQPNMGSAIYFKTWSGTVNGVSPTGGGGGGGFVSCVLSRNVSLDRVSNPLHLYQTNGAHSNDAPSRIQFSNLTFEDWHGTSLSNEIVDLQCSAAAPCPNMLFKDMAVVPPSGQGVSFVCVNVVNEVGLPGGFG
ncbi:pectin lyase fold/virulence factor [Cytidiella melzeri]|nr:pectin lyase fold/virulence factor [Cytidiella melzeri]